MDLRTKDIAELLGVTPETIRTLVASGEIPAYHIENDTRFSALEMEPWLLHHKACPSGGTRQFCVYRSLHQGDLLPPLEGATTEELIVAATRHIAPLLDADPTLLSELLLERERLMPTALGRGIALPHTRDFLHKGCDRLFFVYPQEPLDYGALDHERVHTLIFLFAASDKGHLQLLAKLAHLAQSSPFPELLKTKPSKQGLLEWVRSWEGLNSQH